MARSVGTGGELAAAPGATARRAPHARRRCRLPPRLPARVRGHRVEAPGLAVCQRPHTALAQVQEPGGASGEARGRGSTMRNITIALLTALATLAPTNAQEVRFHDRAGRTTGS